jgi:hypothetical protein
MALEFACGFCRTADKKTRCFVAPPKTVSWRVRADLCNGYRRIFSVPAAPPNYFARTWQAEQGLSQNKVTAVVQTRDGYLWAGTCNGLARFAVGGK